MLRYRSLCILLSSLCVPGCHSVLRTEIEYTPQAGYDIASACSRTRHVCDLLRKQKWLARDGAAGCAARSKHRRVISHP
ncbi:hypothetical protein CALVIDRAFT_245263 [Calocera viscosa TUFC12733]|uniref:Uncharacterized protein n=1 Tax=Calocera viscosa (strain TUFC12733) TaxID=1330018 RepID=A0A167JHI0_CALVF|nr:hypothetical protein CALVIDRAFT_245263 [Calocera viscosa TUFC12733]